MSSAILVVEDNPITRKMVRVALAAEGYRVLEAGDGRTALELVARERPDLILQDLLLPDMDGFDLVGQIHALPAGAEVPILAFSGFLSQPESARALALGFSDLLVKPVEPSRLVEIVRSYLPSPVEATGRSGRERHLLLVDDDPIQLKLARVHLEQLGFQVTTASNGADALEQARHAPPDAILADVLMPDVDGFQLCLAVRRDRRLARVPVVLCSANYFDKADHDLAARVGASALTLRTPDLAEATTALLAALGQTPPIVPRGQVELLEAERLHRVVQQLERQVGLNVGLVQRVSIQATILSILATFSDAIVKPLSIEVAPAELLGHLLDAGGISTGALYVAEPDGRLRFAVQSGLTDPRATSAEGFFGHPELFERSLEAGHAIVIPSAAVPEDTARGFLARAGVTSAVIVPLVARGERIGALLLASTRRDLTHKDWTNFAQSMAAQIGQTIALSRAFSRLAASEQRYRSLFDNVPVGLFRSTAAGRILDANPAAIELLGYPDRDALLTTSALQAYVNPQDRARWTARVEADGIVQGFETELRRRDGTTVWVQLSARLIRDGECRGVYEGSAENITARKHAEESLRLRARQQAAVADLGQRALTGGDLSALLDEATALVAQTLEVERCEVLELGADGTAFRLRAGVGWKDGLVGHATVGAGADSQAGYALLVGEPVIAEELRTETRFGGAALLHEHGMAGGMSVIISGPERPFGVLGAHTTRRRTFTTDDVHFLQAIANVLATAIDRKRRDETLRASEERFRTLSVRSPIGIFLTDAEGRATYINPLGLAILGLTLEESLGDGWARVLHPEDRQRVLHEWAACVREVREFSAQFRVQTPQGAPRWVYARSSPMRSDTGDPAGNVGTIEDITARKQAAEELQRHREARFQAEKLAAMGELLAGVAHELNNPLSVVLGHAALLRHATGEGALGARADKITQAAERCGRIVKNFLALARQRPPERAEVRLNDVTREAVELLAYALRVDGVEVRFDLAEDLPSVWADPHQLHQVVVNLIANAQQAMRATPPPRQITVVTRFDIEEGRIRLDVADTGPGILPEIQTRIFEPFFTTKPPGQGTGLGLSLCHGIIEEHGGSIAVESTPGHGAVFRIELPVTVPPEARPAVAEAEAARPIWGKTILVVDDERTIAEMVVELLSLDGHHVDTAANGAIALDLLRERTYDLILSDLRMPELDGPGLYREVERRDPQLGRRFIFLTGDSLGPGVAEFLAATGAPALSKPFVMEEVRRVVQQALQTA